MWREIMIAVYGAGMTIFLFILAFLALFYIARLIANKGKIEKPDDLAKLREEVAELRRRLDERDAQLAELLKESLAPQDPST